MTIAQTDEPTLQKPLRLWPGVVVAVLLLLAQVCRPHRRSRGHGSSGCLADSWRALAIVVWWVFFSRAPWSERCGRHRPDDRRAVRDIAHRPRVDCDGDDGDVVPHLRHPGPEPRLRRLGGGQPSPLGRTSARDDGRDHPARVRSVDARPDRWHHRRRRLRSSHWRWTKTPEERLLAQAGDEPAALPQRRTARDKRLRPAGAADRLRQQRRLPRNGARSAQPRQRAGGAPAGSGSSGRRAPTGPAFADPIATASSAACGSRPTGLRRRRSQLWRRPIGPGWSSFAVRGDLLYTQEQRGDDEVVACYNVTTGKPVWTHRDAARFWESNGGAGPRGTPTLSDGRVYTFGATGILNALDAGDGAVVWSRNAASDTGDEGSGLGLRELAVGGRRRRHRRRRRPARRLRPRHRRSALVRPGRRRELQLAASVDDRRSRAGPAVERSRRDQRRAGRRHAALGAPVARLPHRAAGPDRGRRRPDQRQRQQRQSRRLAVAHGPGGWTVEERWTSIGLKPYFNDFVVHNGHAFGFDGSILACIDLEDGKRKWKGGRYGNGQLVLLPDQDLLLVLSEEGELALVGATPDQFTELARFPAIEGKTWNHPVLVGDVLLVRNGQEMAAFRLSLAGR